MKLIKKYKENYYIGSENFIFRLKGFDKNIISFLSQFIYNNRELEELIYYDYSIGFPVLYKPTNELVFLQFHKNFDDEKEGFRLFIS